MKGIINLTDLALLYYAEVKPDLYADADGTRRVIARTNFKKLKNKDAKALKAAKAAYLGKVKDALGEIA